MERRSARGKAPDSPMTGVHGPRVDSPVYSRIEVSSPQHVPDVPEIGGEEVVLNRRGMPARQRKRNRLYYDDEVMITAETKKDKSRSPGKKVKSEPVEVDDDEEELITSDLPDYSYGGEVEVPPSPEEDDEDSSPSKGGRGRTSLKSKSGTKRGDASTSPRGKASKSHESNSRSSLKTEFPHRPMWKIGSRRDSGKVKDTTPKSNRRDSTAKGSKSSDRPRGRPPKDPEARMRSKSIEAPVKPTAKIKKEPGAESSRDENDRYAEKRDREQRAKEKDRERKREKERQLKEREREYSSILPLKMRGKREPSPTNSEFSTGLLQPTGPDDLKQAIDKKTAQDISLRLRNLLKLPKAHKWVCYEWFYSNIDKVLFEGENDFQICLKESFPQLKARKLTRVEWCKIRRLMGKPRRCSQAFFDEEREELGRRRQKIRMIQQRKITDFNYKELPDEIPLQLTIGTKVTARLRRPQDGLFTGTIEGVDTSNNTYRITFDRGGLGTHSIPDYEVLSNEPVETVSTSSFALKIPRRSFGFGTAAFKFQNPGLIGEDGIYRFPTSPFPADGMLGGFPIRLLDMIVRLSKLLKAKREKILQLKELNVEAEKMRSYGKRFNSDYRSRYARCVLDLDSMNKEMAMYVEGIQTYCLEQIAPDHGANQMIVPEQVQEQCRQEANLIVDTYNTKQNRRSVHGNKTLGLIGNLTSLILQVKTLSVGERNLYELKSIKDTIKETKASLEGKNLQLFQNRVEIPMNRIQAGLCMSSKQY